MKRIFYCLFLTCICLSVSCERELMIDASYSMASTNTPVNFTSSESKSSWKYHWDFGDGSSETTTGPSVTHSYSVSGAYLVKLTIQSRWDNAEAETSIDIN